MFQVANDATAADTGRHRYRENFPGMWWLTIATLLSAIVCWFWLIPREGAAAAVGDPQLAQVEDGDIADALTTMIGGPAFFAQFKPSNKECARPLAWVAVSRAPGQAAGAVRIRSGNYVSPLFDLGDVPLRVAVPYPAPYERGQGMLTVLASAGSPVIALTPAWKPALQGGQASHAVNWRPVKKCARANG
jgi:hypothetical protein